MLDALPPAPSSLKAAREAARAEAALVQAKEDAKAAGKRRYSTFVPAALAQLQAQAAGNLRNNQVREADIRNQVSLFVVIADMIIHPASARHTARNVIPVEL